MNPPPALEHLVDENIRRLAAHWLERRAGKAMPGRRDLDPAEFPRLLPFVWMCDFLPGERDFRYRLAGEQTIKAHQRPLRGLRLQEILSPDAYPVVVARYLRVVDEPAIAHSVGAVYLNLGRPVSGERIIFPLSSEGIVADAIIGVTVYDGGSIHPEHLSPNKALALTFTSVSDL